MIVAHLILFLFLGFNILALTWLFPIKHSYKKTSKTKKI